MNARTWQRPAGWPGAVGIERLGKHDRPIHDNPGRKKCPFWSETVEALVAGRPINPYIFTGPDGWDRAKRRRAQHGRASALVLPPGADPAALWWPPVDALVVDARDLNGTQREALARALIRDGVRFACLIFEGSAINVRASWSREVTP